MDLDASDREALIELARTAIRDGLANPVPPALPEAAQGALAKPGASFVTLTRSGRLRGCRGTLDPIQPLAADVAANAFFSAFDDPRFRPLAADERDDLAIEISVLSPLEVLPPMTEEELVATLRPGIDGLILADTGRRATFLPKVWDMLAEPGEFVRELKRKAGLPPGYWARTMRCHRYTTENFGGDFRSP
ncbi:MAG TPA: AmmeMemoRadiSam system protein A [Gammaproteobacteria bacterium]|nr:AmmeMemoRadiSam system protein A [Gammaproteobacteria bacterium]